MSDASVEEQQNATSRRRVIIFAIAFCALVLYVVSLLSFMHGLPDKNSSEVTIEPPDDGIAVVILGQNVQFDIDQLRATILVYPGSDLLEQSRFRTVNGDPTGVPTNINEIYLHIQPVLGSGGLESAGVKKIPAGSAIPQSFSTQMILTGAAYAYPLDHYTTMLHIDAGTVSADGTLTPIPVISEMLVPEGLQSWNFNVAYPASEEAALEKDANDTLSPDDLSSTPFTSIGTTWLQADMRRTASTLVFVIIMLTMMSFLAILALWMSRDLRTARSGTSILQAGLLIGFLFSIPGIRQSLPGAPPLGAYIDVLIYFWVLIAVIGALLSFVYAAIRQRSRNESPQEDE